ncbi:hypothetical protein [Weissella soli]|uniref:hypothetical protein n=1 Tax=Weissella soli TaxID=155866 RepID=UPI0011BB3383|nr:hypothetical protein [Weissella soli]QEA34801.1 hypothetical protein FGL88_03115 [Weissella soli]
MNKNIQTGIVMAVSFIGSYFFKISTVNAAIFSALIGFTFFVLFEIVKWRTDLESRLYEIERTIKTIKEQSESQYKVLSESIDNKSIASIQTIEVME